MIEDSYMTIDYSNEELIGILSERIQYLRTEVKKYKYDFLTGLKMRQDFDGYLKTLFEMYEFEDRTFTLVLVDIDGLHALNRTEGYTAGDQLIKRTAKHLLNAFAECNGTEVFRIGGDEFAVLIKGYDKAKLEEILENLESATSSYTVASKDTQYASPSDIFKKTDTSLIHKKSSRN